MSNHKTYLSYTVYTDGTVKNRFGIIKKPVVSKRGYMVVNIYEGNCKYKTVPIHRILALLFIPNPENKPTVNHIDGNKLNNDLLNLEWASYSENNQHAYDKGLKVSVNMINKKGSLHPRSKKVTNVITGKSYGGVHEAARETGIDFRKISKQALNKNNKEWSY